MTRQDAIALVQTAIDQMLLHDADLLALDVSERAMAHQLARHMSRNVDPPLSVDCEYNRDGVDPKRLVLPRRTALDDEVRATTVFPDVIVHQRNDPHHNHLVLEIKKPGEDLAYDERKLRAFRRELGYRHAAHLILGQDSRGEVQRQLIWVDE